MKVLYCGVYRDGTGWGQAAIDYILSLDAAGIDVVPRPVKLNNSSHNLPLRITQLEQKLSSGCDVVIQHVLPNMMAYNGRMKNIGLFASETSHFRGSGWADYLNMMDEVWVINNQQVEACKKSGVKHTPKVIPHATNIERFQQTYKPLSTLEHFKKQNQFVFYTIGEYVRRKNVMAMVKAFHLEFYPEEPVQLVLKVNIPGLTNEQCKASVEEDCRRVKEGLKLKGCKQETVIVDRLSDEGIMRLHAAGDVFVSSSTGEAWSIPAFDAMAMGKTPIVTNCGGFPDYLSDQEGWLVQSHQEPCFGVTDSVQGLYLGDELWNQIDISHLRSCMREAFTNFSLRQAKTINSLTKAYDFSYSEIGAQMKAVLSNGENMAGTARQ